MTVQAELARALVRDAYGPIARKEASCCGSSVACCDEAPTDINMIGTMYQSVEGYVADADFGLSCGVPTEHAGIAAGDTVLAADLHVRSVTVIGAKPI